MNPSTITNCIRELTAQIALRQDAINMLTKLKGTTPGPVRLAVTLAPDLSRSASAREKHSHRPRRKRAAALFAHIRHCIEDPTVNPDLAAFEHGETLL